MKITIPELSLVVLIGATSSGKSTFARRHFKPTEIISSDFCRALLADDENDQTVTREAFELLHYIAAKRLRSGRLTVVDATSVQREARAPLVRLAREFHVLPVAIVVNPPENILLERHHERTDRNFAAQVVRIQLQSLRRSVRGLQKEGFRHIFTLDSVEDIDAVEIERQPLWNNRKNESGPFDIVGDVHGCFDELKELLEKLGYQIAETPDGRFDVENPPGRRAVFVGDLVDRGPASPAVLRLVMSMTRAGKALCVPGNHEAKLLKYLRGRSVTVSHGLAETVAQLSTETDEFKAEVAEYIDGLVSHYVFDDGRLVVAHAGLKENLQGRGSGRVRDFALYGETTGETDEYGLPVRYNWAAEYRGRAAVVYGHVPTPEPEWVNNTICIDTGCVFGGKLTAFRYPERELVSVAAKKVYYEPVRPLFPEAAAPKLSAQHELDDVLDLDDVTGKRIVETRLLKNITIREENATAALEVMSRFAANPKWLAYLPPTMSPSETSRADGFLEHPAEAFAYYRAQDVAQVVCEEKHMGSRAVVALCRDAETARTRFGVVGEGLGICATRTGRRFFEDREIETEFLERLRFAAERAGFWDEFETGWMILDCELMPWSVKAQALIRQQYAAVGAASRAALAETVAQLRKTAARAEDAGKLLERFTTRLTKAEQYTEAYRRYCWPVESVDDLRLAPFHLLATEGRTHLDRSHIWQMETLAKLCAADEALLLATPYRVVTLADEESVAEAAQWWLELTGRGGEGMVVKPLDFIVRGPRGLVQPAIKCRGKEYLRIIYGAEYDLPENLERLRQRGLSAKRSLALREFALGVEALERFVRREPLRKVHECVFGVLALESEPVDPRL
ncbi:MAG: polynucleotide kinase-phosphatase [Acidobacteria bacterium]|nr:polynucleotide kinase-phosphatase [Acidobacteriota bacterium]